MTASTRARTQRILLEYTVLPQFAANDTATVRRVAICATGAFGQTGLVIHHYCRSCHRAVDLPGTRKTVCCLVLRCLLAVCNCDLSICSLRFISAQRLFSPACWSSAMTHPRLDDAAYLTALLSEWGAPAALQAALTAGGFTTLASIAFAVEPGSDEAPANLLYVLCCEAVMIPCLLTRQLLMPVVCCVLLQMLQGSHLLLRLLLRPRCR